MSAGPSRQVGFVFPGQGSQRVGMLESLPEVAGLARLLDAAEALSGMNLRTRAADGPEDALADTLVVQPLLYLADCAWASALEEAGVIPAAVAGHSLGELAALACAGVYSVEAGLELVCHRARLMAEAVESTPGGMVAVLGLDRSGIADALGGLENVWVANDNSPTQVIVSGTLAGLEEATPVLQAAGATRVKVLKVSGPFHTPLMHSAQEAFAEILSRTAFADARIPVVQNTMPDGTTDAHMIRERLAAQITSPVRWTETMLTFNQMGIDTIIEAGPGKVLSGLARKSGLFSTAAPDSEGVARAVEVICE